MQGIKRFALGTLVAACVIASTSKAQAESFTVKPPITIFTTQQLKNFGIDYPDLPIGVVRKGGSGKYLIFGSGGSFGGIGPGTSVVPPGTYRFIGSLEKFAPAQFNGRYPAPSLELGRLQPSPDGSDFDRDYAGAGPTYTYNVNGKDTFIQIYHGEFWKNYPNGSQFYSSEGIASSDNAGFSFSKIGQVLAPHVTRQEFFNSLMPGQTAGMSADGFMAEADVNGNPIDSHTPDAHAYCYNIMCDRNSLQQLQGFAIARISRADFIEAIAMHKVPLFKKYYQPGGGFTEPGIGGSSTLIVTQGKDFLAQPQVRYSPFLNKYLLIYQTNQNKIQVRTSSNIIDWSQSQPVTLVDSTNNPTIKTFYPSAVGLDQNPSFLGQRFFLYYQQRSPTFPPNPNYYCSEVSITP